jgi:hypothetical protein
LGPQNTVLTLFIVENPFAVMEEMTKAMSQGKRAMTPTG